MKEIFLGVLILGILQLGSSALAGESRWDELNKKAKALQSENKYIDAIKTYEKLLQLTQKNYGEKNIKVAEILIEMSLIQRYDLNNEKRYNELQGEAKKIRLTLNGKVNCREPAKWTYEQCQERWLGPDPCFKFTDYRNYIKVTYYGLEGSDFKTPQDLIQRLNGLFGKFEAMDTTKIKNREAVRIKLRYEGGDRHDRDGKYMMPEFRYEEFMLLPLKQGFLVFNFNMNHHVPIPNTFSKEEAPKSLYGDAYENYQTWSSFIESCSVTQEAKK
jgi:hypothetical protein